MPLHLLGLLVALAAEPAVRAVDWIALHRRVEQSTAALVDEATLESFRRERDARITVRDANAGEPAPGALRSAAALSGANEATLATLADDQSDRAALFGVPTAVMSRRVAAGSLDMLLAMDRASAALPEAIARAEALPESQRTPEVEERIVAAIHQRDTLFPLRSARALLMSASLVGDAALRRDLLDAAARSARAAEAVSAWAAAERSLLLGLAALGSGDAPAAVKHFAAARDAAGAKDAPPEVMKSIAPDLALGTVLATQKIKDTAAALAALDKAEAGAAFRPDDGPRDLGLALVAAGTRLRLARGAEDEASGFNAEAAAYRAFRALIDSPDFMEPMADRRAAAIERLGPSVPDAAGAGLPAIALIARGSHLLDEKRPADAAPLLVAALARPADELGALAPLALSLAGRAASRDGAPDGAPAPSPADLAGALDHFARLAREFPADPEAPGGVLRACAAAERLFALASPAAPTENIALRRKALAAFRTAHESTAINVPHRAELRARFVELLTRDLGELRPSVIVAQLREADAVAGALLDDPRALADARLDVARAWTAVADLAFANAEAFGDLEVTVDTSRRQATAQARAAFDAAGRIADPSAGAARRRAAAALIAAASLRLNDAKGAWEAIARVPDLDPSTESDVSFLAAGARSLAADDRLDDSRAWIERLRALDAGAACRAMRAVSDHAWLRTAPIASGFAADSKPGAIPELSTATARLAAGWDGWPDDADRREERRRLAWTLVVAGESAEAMNLFEALINNDRSGTSSSEHPRTPTDSSPPTPRGLPSADLLRGLGEAAVGAGKDEDAFAAFKQLAADHEARRDYSRPYWHAWTRMVEILSRQNADGSRTDTIRREAARLELLDSARQQADCVARIRAVNAKLDDHTAR